MDRREFLKIFGAGTATTALALAGCKQKDNETTQSRELGPIPTDKMTYRQFASLGSDKVSLLGFGCMRFPMKPAEDGKGEVIDQAEVNDMIDYAMAHGVNYYDTAPVYLQGQSERSVAEALKKYPRESYYLATKLSNFQNHSYEASLKMYQNSFSEMQTDYIDFYMLHALGGGGMATFENRFVKNGMLDFLLEERKKGKIRHLGFSYHGNQETLDALLKMHDDYLKEHNEPLWEFVMIQLNYIDWRPVNRRSLPAEYQYDELHKRDIPVAIMEPLLGGRLAKVADHIVARLKQRAPESSVASWAFRFAGTPKGVYVVNSGMSAMEHLQDNIRTFAPLQELTDDDNNFLFETAKLISEYPTVPCTDCKYCMPCPYGIDIPTIFKHYNKCLVDGALPSDSQSPEYRKLRRAYLIGYDRSVPKLRQADHCIGCGQCSEECEQHIDIPRQLHKIARFVEQLKQDV